MNKLVKNKNKGKRNQYISGKRKYAVLQDFFLNPTNIK